MLLFIAKCSLHAKFGVVSRSMGFGSSLEVQKLSVRLDQMSPRTGARQRDILGPGKSQWGYLWHQHQPGDSRCQQRKEIFGGISSNKANEDLNPMIILNPPVFATKYNDGGKRGPLAPYLPEEDVPGAPAFL